MDIKKNYIASVSSYFHLNNKVKIEEALSKLMDECVDHYENVEDMLVSFGHPKSVAYTYGYRPLLVSFTPRHKILKTFEYIFFFLLDFYLILCSIYYMYVFGYLPSLTIFNILYTHSFLLILIQEPFLTMCSISITILMILCLIDTTKPLGKENLTWNKEKLYQLPSYKVYTYHKHETFFMGIFILFFFLFALFYIFRGLSHFHTHFNVRMIYYFLQSYIALIILSYILDLSKRIYDRKYLISSLISQIITLAALNFAVWQSDFLQHFLYPIKNGFLANNVFLILAVLAIEGICFFKIVKNCYYLFNLRHVESSEQEKESSTQNQLHTKA